MKSAYTYSSTDCEILCGIWRNKVPAQNPETMKHPALSTPDLLPYSATQQTTDTVGEFLWYSLGGVHGTVVACWTTG